MKKWKQVMLAFAVVTGIGFAALPPAPVTAINVFEGCSGNSDAVCNAGRTESQSTVTTNVRNIINVMFYVIGIIAVIMLIVGGIRYTTSAGDASRVKAAKDTIMYSVVGLVVALLAFAIVNFVLGVF